jgi:hypothetical protein
MQEIRIEDVYYSYLNNGIISNWKLDVVFRSGDYYECYFTNMETGNKEIKMIKASSNPKINHMVDAIFCD